MNIRHEWEIQRTEQGQFPAAFIAADDGATYAMDADRARRLVRLWNAYVGIPTSKIPKKVRLRGEAK